MDYTRPNHVPTDAEEARQTEQEQRGLSSKPGPGLTAPRVFSGHGQYRRPGFSHNRRRAWICCGPVCVCCCHVFRPTRPC